VFSLAFPAGTAAADEPSAADRAMAETLFRTGRDLVEAGKVAEGCAKLEESQRLEAKVGTLLNVALCHEKLGKSASAWIELLEVGSQAARLHQEERAAFAKDRAKALEKTLSRVTLIASRPTDGLVVSLDGRPLGSSALGVAMPVDPGEHQLRATAPGKAPWAQALSVAPGPATKTVEIPALTDEATPAAPAPVVASTAATPGPLPPPARSTGLLVGGIASSGVGLVGLVVGGIFGALTFSKESQARSLCPDHYCGTQAGLDLHNDARKLATISTVGFGVGIAAAGAGLTLILVSRPARGDERKSGTWIAPTIGREGTGLQGGVSF
jgi:hypothetical protein